jgi:hypothetical protein
MQVPYRYWVTRAGEHLTHNQLARLSTTLKYLEIGLMLRQLGYRLRPRVDKREELFDLVGREVGNREVLYLEFGVYQGKATRYWSKMLSHPQSKLHGFDSFEGLPETWTDTMAKGYFSTGGAIPVIDDPRVQFFKGWFDQTLAAYQVPEHDVLVLNLDADIYSSTIYVLNRMSAYIVPGTYLYFDEFNDPQNELRAFMEFTSSSKRKFVLRGATNSLQNVLFQCVA